MASMIIPLGRPAQPAEAAGPVLFLSSELANYVHGQILNVTGGQFGGMYHLADDAASPQLIGVPIDSVGRSGGTELGPAALRELGIVAALEAADGGDLEIRIRGADATRRPELGSVDVLGPRRRSGSRWRASLGSGERTGAGRRMLRRAARGARRSAGSRSAGSASRTWTGTWTSTTARPRRPARRPTCRSPSRSDRGPAAWVDAAGGASLEPADTALIGFRDKEESLTYGMLQPEDLDPEPIHLSVEAVRTEGPAAASDGSRGPSPPTPSGSTSTSTSSTRTCSGPPTT